MADELNLVRALYPAPAPARSVLADARAELLAHVARVSARVPRAAQLMPHLIYDDVAAALTWLTEAFGFMERLEGRVLDADGLIGHAEMQVAEHEDAPRVMLGPPSIHGDSPRQGVSTMIHLYVDDVDGHHARARAAGAVIAIELENTPWGDRRYQATDPQGHRWHFAERLDAPTEDPP